MENKDAANEKNKDNEKGDIMINAVIEKMRESDSIKRTVYLYAMNLKSYSK